LLLLPLQLVLLECANIALNLLTQQRKRLAEERTAQSLTGKSMQDDTAAAGTTVVSAAAAATPAAADAKAAPATAESKAPGVGGSITSNSTVEQDVASTAKQVQQPQAADGGG
jgi:hypothetical protein